MPTLKSLLILVLVILYSSLSGSAQTDLHAPLPAAADTTAARQLLEEAKKLVSERKLDAAGRKVEEARMIFLSVLGPMCIDVANCWNFIGNIYYEQGIDEAARKAWDSTLVIQLEILSESHPDIARTYNSLGFAYRNQRNYEQSLLYFKKSLDIKQEILGEAHPDVATTYSNLGIVYEYQGNFKQALLYYEQALNIRLAAWGEFHLDVASSYNDLGVAYKNQGKYDQAVSYYEKALDIELEILGENHRDVAGAYYNLAWACKNQGNFEKAVFCFEKALAIQMTIPDKSQRAIADTFLGIGAVHSDQGKYSEAIEYYEKALNIYISEPKYKQGLASSYNNLGLVHMNQGKYNKAIEYYEKSLSIQLTLFGGSHPNVIPTYMNLAIVYINQGNNEKAIEFFEKTLTASLAVFGEFHPYVANSYLGLGTGFYYQKSHEKATEYYLKSLDVCHKVFGDVHPYTAYAYSNLGNVYLDQEKFAETIEYYNKALTIQLEIFGALSPDVAATYYNLGGAHDKDGNFSQAVHYYEEALSALNFSGIDTLTKVNSMPYLIKTLFSMGKLFQKHYLASKNTSALYRSRKYFHLAKSVLDFQSQTIDSNAKISQTEDALSVADGAISTHYLLAQLTDSLYHLQEAFFFSENTKSYFLYKAMEEAHALAFAGIPDSLLKKEYALRNDIARTDKQRQENLNTGLPETDSTLLTISSKLFDLNREYEGLKARFERDYPAYYRLRYDLSVATVEEVQRDLIQPGQALLEYFVGDSSIFLFLVKKDDYQVVEVKKDFPLEDWVRQLRRGLTGFYGAGAVPDSLRRSTMRDYAEAAHLLYGRLVAPVKKLLPERLIIVPDGVLGYLPFEALISEAPAALHRPHTFAYLLRDHAVSYSYSATLLREMRQKQHRTAPTEPFLAFAPYYNGDTTVLAAHFASDQDLRKDLQPLPFSGEEVYRLSRQMKGRYFLGEAATEERFTQVAGQARILHLATHGQANDRIGDYCFLAFAEVKDSVENELLFVRDIYNLELNADLVVLSACETALGELKRGEGIISLARAFAYAGAKSIVNSLWSINDEKTKELMLEFYRNLRRGLGKDEALRQAKLRMIGQPAAHPFFWAGFIPIGDMEAIR